MLQIDGRHKHELEASISCSVAQRTVNRAATAAKVEGGGGSVRALCAVEHAIWYWRFSRALCRSYVRINRHYWGIFRPR